MVANRSRALWVALLAGSLAWIVPPPATALHGTAEVAIRGVAQAEGDPDGDEDTTIFTFPVDVDAPLGFTDQEIRITYETVDGTATSPDDFGAVTEGEVAIPPGPSPSGEIDIEVASDTELEPHETFELHLLTVTAGDAEIVDGEATGTIWNDDPPALSVSDGTGQEGEGITFFLRLSHRTVNEVQVRVATRDGTATAGEDYEGFDETVTLPPHSNERTIVIQALEDDVEDPDENLFVDLSMPENAIPADATGEGLITDDDAFDVDAGQAKSGESAAPVSLTGSAACPNDCTYTWDFGDGTPDQTGETVQHRFAETGTYTVTLTVEGSSSSAEDTTTATITDSGEIERSFGSNREGTAIDVSRDHWDQADTVLLAIGYDNAADALAAGPLATKLDAPLLLTNPNGLPDEVKQELDRLDASRVVIVGGAHAVPQEQADELAASGYQVQRIAGVNRFGTAADIATEVGATSTNEVTIALGQHADENRDDWPDALSAGSFASLAEPLPSLLTHSSTVPQETLDALAELDTDSIFLLGGNVAISDAVEQQLESEGYTVQRVFGVDRYATSVAAGEIVMDRYPAGQVHPVLATGQEFPDGLTGGALAGEVSGPVVLVPTDTLDNASSVRDFLRKHANPFDVGTIVGGDAAVSNDVQSQARSDIDTF